MLIFHRVQNHSDKTQTVSAFDRYIDLRRGYERGTKDTTGRVKLIDRNKQTTPWLKIIRQTDK